MSQSLSTARAEIKTKMESVSGMGIVNDYRRNAHTWDEIADGFKSDDRINGWIIEMTSAPADWGQMTNELIRTYNFRIWGLYSVKDDDASGKVFEDLTDEVLNELTKDRTLNQKAHRVMPAQLVNIDDNLFSGVLCHRCEILLTVELRLSL